MYCKEQRCPNILGEYGSLIKDSYDSYLVIKGNSYIFKGDKSVKIVFVTSYKGYALEGKNLLSLGANSFLLE